MLNYAISTAIQSDLMRGLFIPFIDQTKKQSCRFVFISWVPKEFKKSTLCRSTFSKNRARVGAEYNNKRSLNYFVFFFFYVKTQFCNLRTPICSINKFLDVYKDSIANVFREKVILSFQYLSFSNA